MCLIGEAPGGDTGTPAFAAALHARFSLVQRLPLPNWSDSCHDLTIWERRTSVRAGAPAALEGAPQTVPHMGYLPKRCEPLPPLACCVCGAGGSFSSDVLAPTHSRENDWVSGQYTGHLQPAEPRRAAAEAAAGTAAAPDRRLRRCRWCRELYCSAVVCARGRPATCRPPRAAAAVFRAAVPGRPA